MASVPDPRDDPASLVAGRHITCFEEPDIILFVH